MKWGVKLKIVIIIPVTVQNVTTAKIAIYFHTMYVMIARPIVHHVMGLQNVSHVNMGNMGLVVIDIAITV